MTPSEKDMMDTRKVGSIVHYLAYGSAGGEFPQKCRAAVVAEYHTVYPMRRDIAVLNPQGYFLQTGCKYAPYSERKGGTWHPMEECGN